MLQNIHKKKTQNKKQIKKFSFHIFLKLFILLSIEGSIQNLLRYEFGLVMDDCFKQIKINNEVKYSVDYCDYDTNRILTFNNFVGNYGDKIQFSLRDDGDMKEGRCYIKGYIKINEYKVDTEKYKLWKCSNCKHILLEGNFKVVGKNELNCGGNLNKEIVYEFTFSVPNNLNDLKNNGIIDNIIFFLLI